jgi:hypothetical protein
MLIRKVGFIYTQKDRQYENGQAGGMISPGNGSGRRAGARAAGLSQPDQAGARRPDGSAIPWIAHRRQGIAKPKAQWNDRFAGLRRYEPQLPHHDVRWLLHPGFNPQAPDIQDIEPMQERIEANTGEMTEADLPAWVGVWFMTNGRCCAWATTSSSCSRGYHRGGLRPLRQDLGELCVLNGPWSTNLARSVRRVCSEGWSQ